MGARGDATGPTLASCARKEASMVHHALRAHGPVATLVVLILGPTSLIVGCSANDAKSDPELSPSPGGAAPPSRGEGHSQPPPPEVNLVAPRIAACTWGIGSAEPEPSS
jgi:hypothetical protein